MEPYNRNLEKAATPTPQPEKKGWLPSGSTLGGIVVLLIGSAILMKQLSYHYDIDYPRWLFSWPMGMIVVSLYIGARHQFRNWGWLIPFAIGLVFLSERMFRSIDIAEFAIPAIIICVGLYMIFRPKRKTSTPVYDANAWSPEVVTNEDGERIDSVSIFGSAKKNVLSKNFKGGDVVNFFGGTELNLMQADINGVIMLDITCVFGGAKIIVPSNWKLQIDAVNIFGGIDDKRQLPASQDPGKTLVLDGTVIFGGIEIKSY
jgi:predicted membrane protein